MTESSIHILEAMFYCSYDNLWNTLCRLGLRWPPLLLCELCSDGKRSARLLDGARCGAGDHRRRQSVGQPLLSGPPEGPRPLSGTQVGWAINNFMLIAWSMFCYAIKIIAWRVQRRRHPHPASSGVPLLLPSLNSLLCNSHVGMARCLLALLKTLSVLRGCI